MAVDIEALKALGMSDKEINQLISIEANGFPLMTATPQPVTNRVAGAYDYTPLYGAGEIIPGLTASIFQNLGIENPNVPVFELLGSANKGGNNANERMTFAAQPGQSYRLVNKATGEVLGEASTPEGISALVEQSNALSKQLGKKADIAFEQSNPEVFGGGYTQMFRDEPNILFDTPMKLIAAGMLAATGAGAFQPGGFGGVGAAGAGGATGTTAAATGSGLVPGALQGTNALSFAPVATTAVPASVAAPIIVTGTGATSAAIPAAITAAAATPTLLSSAATPPTQPSPPVTAPVDVLPQVGADIVATAPTNLLPAEFLAPAVVSSAAAANALGSTTAQSPDVTQGMTPEEIQDISMSGAGGGGLLAKLTANMNLVDYLQLASLVGSAGAGLLGGGGGSGTAVPYVSPFGPGMGAGGMPTGPSRQLNPTIADYERYGFGPEALFFAPQSNVVAPTTTGPASAMVNPQYVPLI
jgi:hypothetical protein